MAKLINGNGNLAIYAEEDADWFGSIFGNTTAITGIGNQFAYSLLDANTVGVQDGVIISKEGRRVQLNANEIDEFDIPTGAQGTTSYYIIGYHLITDETSAQTCETFVELMDNGTDTIPEGTFRGGDDEVYISLYRVKQVDLAITQLTLLLPKVSTISEINQHLTDIELDVEKISDYKATEEKIGKYLGKDLYRKTISYPTSISSVTIIDNTLTSSYIDDLVSLTGSCRISGNIEPLPLVYSTVGVFVDIKSGGLTVEPISRTATNTTVTVLYTKA